MAAASPWIKDVTTASFRQDVLERSRDVPVIVDFWAPWCGPCRQLGPLLEKIVQEKQGRIELAKVDVDQEPQLAEAAGVQQIPFVLAIVDGRPLGDLPGSQPRDNLGRWRDRIEGHFYGVLPEAQLREWVDALLPSPAEEAYRAGEALQADDPAAAEAKFRTALDLAPELDAAKVRLAQVLMAQNRDDEARTLVAELEARGWLEPETEAVKAELELRHTAQEAGGLGAARKAAEAAPDDLAAQLVYADALAVAGRHKDALEMCLKIVARDKTGTGVAAKETMVKLFGLLGPTSELASEYRHKLATLLY